MSTRRDELLRQAELYDYEADRSHKHANDCRDHAAKTRERAREVNVVDEPEPDEEDLVVAISMSQPGSRRLTYIAYRPSPGKGWWVTGQDNLNNVSWQDVCEALVERGFASVAVLRYSTDFFYNSANPLAAGSYSYGGYF